MKSTILVFLILVTTVLWAQPPVTNGLTLHLDAATGLVGSNPATWTDQSGLGNDVTTSLVLGTDPTTAVVRGNDVVRFTGGSIMKTANPNIVTGTTGTIFTVVSRFVTGTKISVSSDNNLGQELLLLDNIAYHNSTANNFVGLGHQCISSIPMDSIVIESATYRPQRFLSNITHYANEVVANQTVVNNYGNPIDYYNVGRYAYIGGRIWENNPNSSQDLFRGGDMDMYEILVYDRELSQAEVDLVHQYLKCKYAVNYNTCNIVSNCSPTVQREIVWQDSCTNNNIAFSLSNTSLLDSVMWTFGDPLSGSNTSTLLNPLHIYTVAGSYTVQAVTWYNGVADTTSDIVNVYPDVLALNLGADTVYCNTFSRLLVATQNSQATYQWSNNSTSSTLFVDAPGQYWVTVYGPCDTITDTIDIGLSLPITFAVNDTTICPGTSAVLNATTNNATDYLWQNNTSIPQILVSTPGQYWVTASNSCYSVTDTATISFYDTLQYIPLIDTTLCEGEIVTLDVTTTGATNYLWDNGSTSSSRTITTSGTYWVMLSNPCQVVRDTIVVNYILNPIVDLGPDMVNCAGGDTLAILTAGAYDTYLWQDSSTQPTYVVVTEGQYYVTVGNVCGVASDTVNVSTLAPLQWDYIDDTSSCEGDTIVLDVSALETLGYTWQWNDSLKDTLRVFDSGGVYWLEIVNGCGQIFDTIEVVYHSIPEVDLGPDTTICGSLGNAGELILDAGQHNSYLWNDSTITRNHGVEKSGTYSVTVTSVDGCIASDTITIGKEGFYIPNAFSPNDDGINDVYRVYGFCDGEFEIQVFDRWGEKVFETTEESIGWDGRFKGVLLHPGLFVYQIRYVDLFGEVNFKTGTLILLR